MDKKRKFVLKHAIYLLIIGLQTCFIVACSDNGSVLSLAIPIQRNDSETQLLQLKALNKNAKQAEISQPEKAADMYFLFEQNPILQDLIESGRYALELVFEAGQVPQEKETSKMPFAAFSTAFLYTNDITDSGEIITNFTPKHPVTAFIPQKKSFTLSLGFSGKGVNPQDICGFAVHTQTPIKLKEATITPTRYGWLKDGVSCWSGFSAAGGTIPAELFTDTAFPLTTELPRLSRLLPHGKNGRDVLCIHFAKNILIDVTTAEQPHISFTCGKQRISVRRAPNIYQTSFDGCLFMESVLTPVLDDAAQYISGMTMDYYEPEPFTPLIADTELILDWPQEYWRQPDYELFSWEQFPSVLVFDFANYEIQDRFLKRIAFFTEKRGFTGTLVHDTDMQHLHGFNAHDYRAETLAAFFQQAAEEAFPLNKSEQLLRQILLHNNIIVATEAGFTAGEGAIVSLSRQSAQPLRRLFITHECLHGIYFTEKRFRDVVDEVFETTDPKAILFLRRYFESNPTLNYNTDDLYLLKNEFMAYILQQSSTQVEWYYINRLSRQKLISKAEPELCNYIREINALPFKQAADRMNDFLYATWGLKGGRIHLTDYLRYE